MKHDCREASGHSGVVFPTMFEVTSQRRPMRSVTWSGKRWHERKGDGGRKLDMSIRSCHTFYAAR